ncbi:Integrase, catalytic core [Corchorus capsularis]|uniref:Integrase, catalytic core n=1 Tax=Corchorus capsularis TaxID=210143 RepID=A0A1R3IRU3_COCAP|nr:Integrase, catalytic core [Corchorus capsularis]
MVRTQFSKPIKRLRADSAGEYKSGGLKEFLASQGTLLELSCTDTPQQNGVAERKHRHIMETTRALLLSSLVPKRFWGEAVLTSVYVINRIPSSIIGGISPFERLYNSSPNYSELRIFGSTCFVSLPKVERDQLSQKTAICVFLGYGIGQKGSTLSEQVVPEETCPTADSTASNSAPTAPNSSESIVPKLRRSTRERIPSKRYLDFHCFLSTILSVYEPKSYHEACLDPLWQAAMKEELNALEKTHTWDLVELPVGKSVVDCKWVYKVKTKSDGSVERYKARLVAKGFTQEYGIDYEETFAPVARMTSVRTLIAVASIRGWDMSQMDVKNAFLNGDLHEEVYMKPPPGLSCQTNQVCKLRRALYGLKQAPRAWFEKFSSTMLDSGFVQSAHDSTLFIRQSSRGIVLLLLYVDDMVITGDDDLGIKDIKNHLSRTFEMKDLGPLRYFLGIEVNSSSHGYVLSQVKYASDHISKAGLSDNKIVDTPIEMNVKLKATDGGLLTNATLYRQLVGSLIYLTVTRLDISHAVQVVSQFMTAPRTIHFC